MSDQESSEVVESIENEVIQISEAISQDMESSQAQRIEVVRLSLHEPERAPTLKEIIAEKAPKTPFKSDLPEHTALYLFELIGRRNWYKTQLEQLEIPPRFLKVRFLEYEAKRKQLETNVSNLYSDIYKIVEQYFPKSIISSEPEVTIANILAELPAPEDVVVTKVFHSTG